MFLFSSGDKVVKNLLLDSPVDYGSVGGARKNNELLTVYAETF